MLDRYRKTGGFVQLLNLVETSTATKKQKFLEMITEESPVWAEELQKRMLTFEGIIQWPTQDLMEFIPLIPEKILVAAIFDLPQDKADLVLKACSAQQQRAFKEAKANPPPSPGEMVTCKNKIVTEARTASQNGSLKLEKINPDLVIPDGIESKLRDKFDPNKLAAEYSKSGASSGGSVARSSVNSSDAATTDSISTLEEVHELRKKVILMERDMSKLRHENEMMKNKLEQIRKIA